MELSKKQKAFLEFIPISQIRKSVIQAYALLSFFIPLIISYYYKEVEVSRKLWNIAITIDIVLVIISVPVLFRPSKFFGLFHLLMGFTSVYGSIIAFIVFLIEANSVLQIGVINAVFSVVIYLTAVFIINFSIVRINFLRYPKSLNKISPILLLTPIIGMIGYNLVENTFKINGMAIAMYLLAIAIGIPIHSLYRGYIIMKYKYKPSDL